MSRIRQLDYESFILELLAVLFRLNISGEVISRTTRRSKRRRAMATRFHPWRRHLALATMLLLVMVTTADAQ